MAIVKWVVVLDNSSFVPGWDLSVDLFNAVQSPLPQIFLGIEITLIVESHYYTIDQGSEDDVETTSIPQGIF